VRDVFLVFLRLGSTCFGGPIAHLGYFRREFVDRQGWIDEPTFAGIVAFCSVLPGPTSSQVGMLVGLIRGGGWGALLAWIGFTAPSAIALTAFGLALRALESHGLSTGNGWFDGLLAGLTAAAAAVVAQAVLALARSLCTDRETQTIGLGAAILAIAVGGSHGLQWLPIALGAGVGWLFLRKPGAAIDVAPLPVRIPRGVAVAAGVLFLMIVVVLLLPVAWPPPGMLLVTIARAGTLVFGGGHVVLPLLQGLVGDGLIDTRDFFAGYGAVQAVPGPLFTFAAFLGAANSSPLHGVGGAVVATLTIFIPSFALIFALAPLWNRIRSSPAAAAALRGANASVVGLLGAVLYQPILTTLGTSGMRIGIALGAFALIAVWRVPPWIVVVTSAVLGAAGGALA
jgi:chromate transporter